MGLAHADTEPNNSITTAEPLVAASLYSGSVGGGDLLDTYYFHAEGETALQINVWSSAGSCAEFTLSSGIKIEPGAEVGPTSSAAYTTPQGKTKVYYFSVEGSCAGTYQFKVSASKALVSEAHPWGNRVAAAEPNENADQARGPLVGGTTYEGRSSSVNDEDWFYFYGRPNRIVTISMATPEGAEACAGTQIGTNPKAMIFATETLTGGWFFDRAIQTGSRGVEKYFLWMHCSQGESYLINLRPPGALSAVQHSRGMRPACAAARKKRRTVSKRLGRAIARTHRAAGPAARRKAKKRTQSLRRKLRRAHKEMTAEC